MPRCGRPGVCLSTTYDCQAHSLEPNALARSVPYAERLATTTGGTEPGDRPVSALVSHAERIESVCRSACGTLRDSASHRAVEVRRTPVAVPRAGRPGAGDWRPALFQPY